MEGNDLSIRGDNVVLLSKQLRSSALNLSNIPYLILRLIRDEMWKEFKHPSAGQIIDNHNLTFGEFVRAQPPNGLGVELKTIENILLVQTRAIDVNDASIAEEALNLFVHAVAEGEGVNLEPLPDSAIDRVQSQINSVAQKTTYELGRLKRERLDLYQSVMRGEISAYRASIEAGFRKRRFSVPQGDIPAAAAVLKKKFSSDDIQILIRELTS